MTTELAHEIKASKRNKYIKWGIIGTIILILLILVIVLPIVLTRSDGGGGGGNDKPVAPGGGNDYYIDKKSIVSTANGVSGVLNMGSLAVK